MTDASHEPLREEDFLSMSDEQARALIAPRRLGVSILLNGTRRLFLATQLASPPRDPGYLPACLEFIHRGMADLLVLLVRHGIYRIFLPAYSGDQQQRDPVAHQYLIEGIRLLTTHPALVAAYEAERIAVRFYGAEDHLPEPARRHLVSVDFGLDRPRAFVHYGIDGGDPHQHLLQLVYQLGSRLGRVPSRQEVVELYYGERDVKPIDILIAFNRTYARLGIPPCLDGKDRIYTTAISPLGLTVPMLRRILYDYLYRDQDPSRNYLDLSEVQLERIKSFHALNRESVMGLTGHFEGLCFPRPSIRWPSGMTDASGEATR